MYWNDANVTDVSGHVSRDSETDFTLDSEQSTTEDFNNFNPSPVIRDIREPSESPEPGRFERSGVFYKSTRFRGGSYEDDTDSCRDYRSSAELSGNIPEKYLGAIPEKYFVTVSGFDDTSPVTQPQVVPKARNVTEVWRYSRQNYVKHPVFLNIHNTLYFSFPYWYSSQHLEQQQTTKHQRFFEKYLKMDTNNFKNNWKL